MDSSESGKVDFTEPPTSTARSARRRDEEEHAGERTIDVKGKARKTFRIPPRILRTHGNVSGLVGLDESIIALGATKKGGVNAAGLIAFSKRSIAGGKHEIFSIVDRGPARIATKTKAFGDSPKQKSRLFYLHPYPSDRNPDELAWKHLKAATVGGMVIAGRTGFQTSWAAHKCPVQIQNHPC